MLFLSECICHIGLSPSNSTHQLLCRRIPWTSRIHLVVQEFSIVTDWFFSFLIHPPYRAILIPEQPLIEGTNQWTAAEEGGLEKEVKSLPPISTNTIISWQFGVNYIIFLDMLKFSKNAFLQEIIFVKENEWSFEILRNILLYCLFGRCVLKLLLYYNIQVLKVPLPSSTLDTTTFISQRADLTFTNPIQNLKSHHNHTKNPWRRNKKHSKANSNSSITPTHIHIYSVHWCKKAKGTSTYDKAKGREEDICQAWSLKF